MFLVTGAHGEVELLQSYFAIVHALYMFSWRLVLKPRVAVYRRRPRIGFTQLLSKTMLGGCTCSPERLKTALEA